MNNPMIAHLTIHCGQKQRRVPLTGRVNWNIGRNDDCAVFIKERWISRNHAMIQRTENSEYYLIDLGSRNGTFVNGRRVTIPVMLHNGDMIGFGQTASAPNQTLLEFTCPQSPQRNKLDLAVYSGDVDQSATIELSEQRLISVLVMDIRNFTKLTREMDEGLLSKMIGSWFRDAGSIIQKHGSKVDKYIGDAVMAVWIHPTNLPEGRDIVHICLALRELWQMTQVLQTRFTVPFPLRVGVGVNTGYAVVGNKGTSDRPDYTPLGDTVNAAFRLESCTKEIHQDIALGEVTHQWFQTIFTETASPFQQHEVALKGYEQPTQTNACSFEILDEFLNSVNVS
ncbi:MAG TPA: adenylate/guanylate cyclase domain-containing protein [Planctomycetaceae bacterium]|nr:adenylate/guanylate cyclase domain-containing protein [Planctomycetaceae bacterium]